MSEAAGIDDQTNLDIAVASAIAAVTPAPTPEPVPTPTPEIQLVEVAPQECLDFIRVSNALLIPAVGFVDVVVRTYLDYLDRPDQNLADFGARVEDLLSVGVEAPTSTEVDEWTSVMVACREASR